MSLRCAWLTALVALLDTITSALLGRSIYAPERPPDNGNETTLDSPSIVDMRRQMGGQLQMPPWTQSRWYLADLETAEHCADSGDLRMAGRLMSAARRDGIMAGVLSTRTGGMVRLPRLFKGDEEIVKDLDVGHGSVRSVFDELLPPSELELLAADGVLLGVGVGELVPVKGRDYPVLVRLSPEALQYIWSENRWYFMSALGRIAITPGDGRWVLHTPGGRYAPWSGTSLWRCIGRAYIRKEHANLHKDNWEAKLANPARVAVAPQGATEAQKEGFFQRIMAWGINSVFGMTPGYDVKLIESNGRGADSFEKTIAAQNDEMIVSIAGQRVTTDGGAGFQNSDIHKTIRADLIQSTADSLAYTINTQCLPVFIAQRYGEAAILRRPVVMEYDVTPPKDRNSEAQSLVTVGNAIQQLTAALSAAGRTLDVDALCERFVIPTTQIEEVALTGDAPNLRLVGGTDVDGPGDTTAPPTEAGESAADNALNGAQVTSLVDIVVQVAGGQLPRDAAVSIIKRAFLVDETEANEMLGSAGQGFTPTSSGNAPTPKPAPGEVAA